MYIVRYLLCCWYCAFLLHIISEYALSSRSRLHTSLCFKAVLLFASTHSDLYCLLYNRYDLLNIFFVSKRYTLSCHSMDIEIPLSFSSLLMVLSATLPVLRHTPWRVQGHQVRQGSRLKRKQILLHQQNRHLSWVVEKVGHLSNSTFVTTFFYLSLNSGLHQSPWYLYFHSPKKFLNALMRKTRE